MASQASDCGSFFALVRSHLHTQAQLQSDQWDYDFLSDQPQKCPRRFQWEDVSVPRDSVSTRATNSQEDEELKSDMEEIRQEREEEVGVTAIPMLHVRFPDF